jgi:pyruvate/2-oxoglutarate dehydrogenase complex dihydrolipoamide acyltransferase (E2) component
MLEAQQLISTIAVEQSRYNTAKARADQQAKTPVQEQPKPQEAPVQQRPQPDPRAQDWAEKNAWFGDDKIMTTAAFTIHQQLVEEEGFDPKSDEYYTEVDSRIRKEFPHKFQTAKKSGGAQVAAAAASASRSTAKSGRRSVKLSHSQVAIAKKLGVPLEEYAKYVKE